MTKQPKNVSEMIDAINSDLSEDLTMAGSRRMAASLWAYIPSLIEQLRMKKQETCGCDEEDGLGYHTKECEMEPYGYNEAVDTLNSKIDSILK